MTHTTEHTEVEEVMKLGSRDIDGDYLPDGMLAFEEKWLREALTTLTTKHQEELEKAVKAERRKVAEFLVQQGEMPDRYEGYILAATKTDKQPHHD